MDKIRQLFEQIIQGEDWANRVSLDINKCWLTPHLAYSSKSHVGCVRFPPHRDMLATAEWIAHECGHLEDFDHNSPNKLATNIERFIRSEKAPSFIISLVRKIYYLVFWKERMRKESSAHRTSFRLLKKVGVSIDAYQNSVIAYDELISPWSWYDFIERVFQNRVQKGKDEFIKFAEKSDCTP